MFLREHSNLPGPRANLELLWTVFELGDESFFARCLKFNEHVAGLCEPDLLRNKENAETVMNIVYEIIVSITSIQERSNDSFKALKNGLGNGLSVAMVAIPAKGIQLFEQLLRYRASDISASFNLL